MSDSRHIGILLALCSSVAIGSSYVTIKAGLRDASERQGLRGTTTSYGYLRNPTWWAGMVMQVCGELFNFAAYAFAPAVLVAPLGALSVLTGVVLGAYFLGERLDVVGRLGCAMSLVGSVLIVANAPPDKDVESIDEMLELAVQPGACELYMSGASQLLLFHHRLAREVGYLSEDVKANLLLGFLLFCISTSICCVAMIYVVCPR